MSGQTEDSDVARALAAFGAPLVKYRVFPRPPVPPIPLRDDHAENEEAELPAQTAARYEAEANAHLTAPILPPPQPLLVPERSVAPAAVAESPLLVDDIPFLDQYHNDREPESPSPAATYFPPPAAPTETFTRPDVSPEHRAPAPDVEGVSKPVFGMFRTFAPPPVTPALQVRPAEARSSERHDVDEVGGGAPPLALRDIFRRL